MATSADVLILGAGPAGLSAALTLARQRHSSVIFDEGTYRNDRAAYMHLLPGFDHVSPEDYRQASRNNILSNYDHIKFENTTIVSTRRDNTGIFIVADGAGMTWSGKKLILANGVEDIPPLIDGYAECWGKTIFHCLFCKGYEERGSPSAGVLAIGGTANAAMALHVARQVVPLSESIIIFTNGSNEVADAIEKILDVDVMEKTAKEVVIQVDARRILRLVMQQAEGKTAVRLEFEDGASTQVAFLAHTPATKPRGPFVDQLGLEQTPSGDVKAGVPFGQTSLKGVFAAGDNCGLMKNVPNAIFSGSQAGMGASTQIIAEQLGHAPLFG